MNLTHEIEGSVCILTLAATLRVTDRATLLDTVRAAAANGVRLVVVDMATVGSLDSAGLGALVSLAGELRAIGGDLRLAGLREEWWPHLALARVDTLFPRYGSVADARVATPVTGS